MPISNNANRKGLFFRAFFDDRPIGPSFAVQLSYPSKSGLVRWMFEVLRLLKLEGSPVAHIGTSFMPGQALTPSGSSPDRPVLPPLLLNQLPFSYTGQISSKGSSSGSVSFPRVLVGKKPDTAKQADNGLTVNPGTSTSYTWTDDRVGVTLPKWRAMIEAGANATTGMTARRGSMAGMPGHMVVKFKRSYDVKENWVAAAGVFHQVSPTDFTYAGLESVVDGKALSKLHERLYDLQHAGNVGETLGEFKASLAMIGKPLSGLRSLVDLYKKRQAQIVRDMMSRYGKDPRRFDYEQFQQLQKSLASVYLEFNFGWIPLANDVLDAIKAAQGVRNKISKKVSSSYVDDRVTSDTTVSSVVNSYCYTSTRVVRRIKQSVRYQVGINPDRVEVLGYAESLGITPRKFVPTLYALLPYSWLVDYFTGINATIDALCADLSFTTWTCKTVRRVCTVEAVSTPDYAKASSTTNGFISAVGSPSASRSTMTTTVRSVPANLIPAPYLTVPKTWKPWLNIAALVVQKQKIVRGGTTGSNLGAIFD